MSTQIFVNFEFNRDGYGVSCSTLSIFDIIDLDFVPALLRMRGKRGKQTPVTARARKFALSPVLPVVIVNVVNNHVASVKNIVFDVSVTVTVTLPDGSTKQIYFVLVLICGDNAGLDEILGFVNSSGNFFCRICKINKSCLKNNCPENVNLLRTKQNYEQDVLRLKPEETGVKENCIWNQVPSFHVTENGGLDVMHDNLEGVANYDMSLLIYYLIYKATFEPKITLEILNDRIQQFDYGYIEMGNKPPIITADMLVKKKKLGLKAAEMMCLIRNFGMIIGDLVPENLEAWNLYTLLCQINDVLLAPKYRLGSADFLNNLIDEHNALYLSICKLCPPYEKENLKPKFHFHVHYGQVMERKGPLRNFWAMRFEAKHAEAKKIASLSHSRINITQTIAIKHQFVLAYSLMTNSNFKPTLIKGSIDRVIQVQNFTELKSCNAYNWLKYNGRLYKKKCSLQIGLEKEPVFGTVEGIFSNNTTIYFLCKRCNTVKFDNHRHSYVIDYQEEIGRLVCINIKDLTDSTPLYMRFANGVHFVTLPYSV